MSSPEGSSSRKMGSVAASRAIWFSSAKLNRSQMLVLQALASHADANYECRPGLQRLATMSRLSERQVRRILHELRQKGYLSFDDNKGGIREWSNGKPRGKSNDYHLTLASNPEISNSDTKSNPDISTGNPDILSPVTRTF